MPAIAKPAVFWFFVSGIPFSMGLPVVVAFDFFFKSFMFY